MDPLAGGGLDAGDQLGEGQRAGGLEIEMDVIPDATGTEQLATPSGYNRCNTGEQPGSPFRIEPRPSVLGGPHQMDPQRQIRVSHDVPNAGLQERFTLAPKALPGSTMAAHCGAKSPGEI